MSGPRRPRAPPIDGGILAEPPPGQVGSLLTRNRQRLARAPGDILGQSPTDFQRQARRAALSAAREYLGKAGEPLPEFGESSSLLMAGHQPELFHPGVWVKNFALHRLARKHHAIPINLVVDNDTAKSAAILLPRVNGDPSAAATVPESIHAAPLPLDHWEGEIPYEERTVHDEKLFADFPDRASAILQPWRLDSMLPAFWSEVRRQAERTRLLGERFAGARRTFERRWGCHNLELPVSVLCRTEPFTRFGCHLLTNLPRFHAIHNDSVRAYRKEYGIRSRNHPVPDLAAEGDWLEAPFWAWRTGAHRRGRLMARPAKDRIELRSGDDAWPPLPLRDPQRMMLAWMDLERRGYKIRSRALTNTLYARVFLADLFIHGIGGAKYDELTDIILRRFYEFEPPDYLTLSATLRLPLPTYPAQPDTWRRLVREVRDLYYNPQRHLPAATAADAEAARLLAEKRRWIEQQPAEEAARRERFQVLRKLTEQLRGYLAEQEQAVGQRLSLCDRQLQANAVLERRDYAFCLFPEERLRPFCEQFLAW